MDKPFWRAAPWSEDFVDIEGDRRARPPYRTRFKMLWDDDALYIGAELEEPHVWGSLTQRDSIVYHDNDFEVFLSPTADNHRYYEIEINALNTVFDLFLGKPYRDGGPADHGWDVRGLRTAVHVDGTLNDPSDTDRGWSVELAMPWSSFNRHGGAGLAPHDGDHWRINFSRVQWDHRISAGAYHKAPGRAEHNWVWSPQGLIDMHRPEQWGIVQFSRDAAAAIRPDVSIAARTSLHRVYYAQARHRHETGRWATSLDQLIGRDPWLLHRPGGCVGLPELETTADGWRARQLIRAADGQVQGWWIRQDSLVWREGGAPYDAGG